MTPPLLYVFRQSVKVDVDELDDEDQNWDEDFTGDEREIRQPEKKAKTEPPAVKASPHYVPATVTGSGSMASSAAASSDPNLPEPPATPSTSSSFVAPPGFPLRPPGFAAAGQWPKAKARGSPKPVIKRPSSARK